MPGLAITSTATTIQSGTVPSGWVSNSNTVEGIACGGTGSRRQAAGQGGTGGGGGLYGKRANVDLKNGGTYYFFNPVSVAPSGTPTNPGNSWFNPRNLALATNAPNAAPWVSGGSPTITGSESDPLGGTAAWKITEPNAVGVPFIGSAGFTQPASQSLTVQAWIYARPALSGTVRRLIVGCENLAGTKWFGKAFDLSTGQIASTAVTSSWSFSGAEILTDGIATGSSGNGWYLIHIWGTTDNAVNDITVWMALENGSGTGATGGSYSGNGTGNVIFYAPGCSFGSTLHERPDQVINTSTTASLFSLYLNAGTSGTTTTAGSGGTSSGAQGDSFYDGGGGYDPPGGTGSGGGGGGAAGPRGVGATATSATGGTGDGGNTAAAANGSYAPWTGGTYGAGGGGTGPASGSGNAGGTYGSGGSGSSAGSSTSNGGRGQAGMFFLTWANVLVDDDWVLVQKRTHQTQEMAAAFGPIAPAPPAAVVVFEEKWPALQKTAKQTVDGTRNPSLIVLPTVPQTVIEFPWDSAAKKALQTPVDLFGLQPYAVAETIRVIDAPWGVATKKTARPPGEVFPLPPYTTRAGIPWHAGWGTAKKISAQIHGEIRPLPPYATVTGIAWHAGWGAAKKSVAQGPLEVWSSVPPYATVAGMAWQMPWAQAAKKASDLPADVWAPYEPPFIANPVAGMAWHYAWDTAKKTTTNLPGEVRNPSLVVLATVTGIAWHAPWDSGRKTSIIYDAEARAIGAAATPTPVSGIAWQYSWDSFIRQPFLTKEGLISDTRFPPPVLIVPVHPAALFPFGF